MSTVALVKAALFDMGGVLVEGPFAGFARFERERGLPDGFLRRVNATNAESNAWARLERGEFDIDGFSAAFAIESETLGHRVEGRDVLGCMSGRPVPQMLRAVERCRTTLRTAMLTNNPEPLDRADSEIAGIVGLFDVVVESSVTGLRKPEPDFYLRACAALEVAPSDCVFLDDLGVNLKPARALGMTTIKVIDPVRAISELEVVTGIRLVD